MTMWKVLTSSELFWTLHALVRTVVEFVIMVELGVVIVQLKRKK